MSIRTAEMLEATSALRPRSLWMRGGAGVLGLLWVGLVWLVGLFLTVASPVGGWFYAALCFLPGLFGTAVMFGLRWRWALVAAGLGSLLLGTVMYLAVPPDHARIRNVAEDVGVPRGWEQVDTGEYGNTWCWKGCPEVSYYFVTDGDPDEAMSAASAHFEDAGWRGGRTDPNPFGKPSEYDPLATGEWHDGRWEARLRLPSAASAAWWPGGEPPAPGTTRVEVTFSAR